MGTSGGLTGLRGNGIVLDSFLHPQAYSVEMNKNCGCPQLSWFHFRAQSWVGRLVLS